jgi:glycosyltransferase involved in cell wall biosynthesis
VDVRAATHSWPVQELLGGTARRLTGGFEFVDAVRGWERRQCDLSVCWCERTGVPAALRSGLPGEPPVAMGTLWMTDPNADLNAVGSSLAWQAVRRAAVVWANSRAQLEVLRGRGVAASRLHLLHTPGIDIDFWQPAGAEPEPGLVLAIGNDRHRDHEFLVRAMAIARERFPAARLELVTQQPVRLPPGLGVRHHAVSHADLRELYSRASVVAVALKPNLHISGSTVLLESFASERPVVISANPGYDEYVRHGATGLLVGGRDEEAFAAAIVELLADPDRALAMGRAGRIDVERDFSSERTMAKLAEILRAA